MRSINLLFIFFFSMLTVSAQPFKINKADYPYIDFKANEIVVYNPQLMKPFYKKLKRLLTVGDEQIQIVQIGDSHIQADLFSGRVRSRLQEYFPGGNGGRGFVFPYTMARTNNPYNYKVSYTGTWSACKNVQTDKDCLLGLAGISVSTTDSETSFTISSKNTSGILYEYTKIRVFYNCDSNTFQLHLQNGIKSKKIESDSGSYIIEWELAEPATEIQVNISKLVDTPATFRLMGVSLDTDDPGIVYHAIGVNGAQVTSFLKCQLLEEQLAQLHPDVVILSLGTNDAYTNDFSVDDFKKNYQILLDRIQLKCPNAAILLTTPGDCYRNRKFANPFNVAAKDAIIDIAKKNNLAVWDFFTIMGGLGSIQKWYNNGLSTSGKIHLTAKGYEIQGDLFFEAIAHSFDNFITEENK